MAVADEARQDLHQLEKQVDAFLPNRIPGAVIPVQALELGTAKAAQLAAEAQLWVKPIRYPTVPKEEECFRLTLHAHQTLDEVARLAIWIVQGKLTPLRVFEK
jgi:7-keto-8-aminopelargonate synthetase-like enzyme